MAPRLTSAFDPEQFVAECCAARDAEPSHRLVREVVARAVSDPAAVLKALGEPKRSEVQPLYRSEKLTILNVIWAPRMTVTPHDHRMWAVIGIYTGREQMSTSLTLFALRNVNLDFLFGYHVPAGQVQALNPIWIFILSPPLAWLYTTLGKSRGGDLSVAAKYAMGFAILSIGFFTFAGSGLFAGPDGKVSMWWMIGGYALISLGELLISGLGLAMVARYVGPALRGFIMGVWFLGTGLSQYLGSWVATFASVPEGVTDPVKTLPLYTGLFTRLGVVAVLGTLLAVALLPVMRRLSVPTAAEPERAAA